MTIRADQVSIRAGGDVYGEGWSLWSNGELGEFIRFAAPGTYTIRVVAYGSPAEGRWPLMAFGVDGKLRKAVTVKSREAAEYAFSFKSRPGDHRLTVSFLNDAMVGGEDRNLYVQWLSFEAAPGRSPPTLGDEADWRTARRAAWLSGYPVYLLGMLFVVAWFVVQPRLGLKALLGLWWLGLALQTHLLPNAIGVLLVALRLPVPTPYPATGALDLGAWLGGSFLLRALLGLTTRERAMRGRERIWLAGFVLSLVLAPLFHRGERIMLLLFGPWLCSGTATWLFALLPLPWLLSFRWRRRLGAPLLLVAVVTGLTTLALCLSKLSITLGAWWDDGHLRFLCSTHGQIGVGTSFIPTAEAGARSFSWQAMEHAELYALLLLPALLVGMRPAIRPIRVRMVGSHLLAGFVPAVLVVLFLLVAGTLYLAQYRSAVAARYFEQASRDAGSRLAREIVVNPYAPAFPFPVRRDAQFLILKGGSASPRLMGALPSDVAPYTLLLAARDAQPTPLMMIGAHLFTRARLDTVLDGRTVRAEALAPLDSLHMQAVSRFIGAPVRIHPNLAIIGDQLAPDTLSDVPRGAVGPRVSRKDGLIGVSLVPCLCWDQARRVWEPASLPMTSFATIGETLPTLFKRASLASADMTNILPMAALWLIAVLVAVVAWWVSTTVYGMGNTITRAVAAMTRATTALRDGDLKHRIEIEGRDELWNVAGSINTMAEGLSRMREMELQAERLERELEIARRVQSNLFPKELPKPSGWEFAAVCRPARAVGGDYYDVFEIGPGRIAFAIGDVAGKGLGPSLVMSTVHAMIRTWLPEKQGDLPALMQRLNEHLVTTTAPEMFVTLFIGIMDTVAGRLRYVNGGHNQPLLLVGADRTPTRLTKGGLVVGILPGTFYEEDEVPFADGSLLVLFSDGVTEAMNGSEEMFEEWRLIEASRQSGPSPAAMKVLTSILTSVDAFAGSAEQADDISIVVVGRGASPAL
jgi:serine phosphatase RsbU (regulator of sigma subunit)